MWSKRLADIRPGTVISYVLLLVLVGYVRVLYGPHFELPFSFMGVDYVLAPWWKWVLPPAAGFAAMFANWIFAEVLQILKRYSYFGFLWGLTLIGIGNIYVVLLATLGVLWFVTIVRLQGTKRIYADYLDIGLMTGVLTLFNLRFLALLAVSWFLFVAYGKLRSRALFIGVWGVVTIHVLTATVYFAIGKFDSYLSYFEWRGFAFDWPAQWMWPSLVAMLFFWILSLGNYITALSRANVVKRQSLSALLILQIAVLALDISGIWSDTALICFVPIGSLVFIANDLQYRTKRWWKEGVFWMFIAAFGAIFFY